MDIWAVVAYAAGWTSETTSGEKTVTEMEWMGCTDPEAMLEFIQGRASERKLRLFVVGCSRFVWEQIIDEGWRAAIYKAELVPKPRRSCGKHDSRRHSRWSRRPDGASAVVRLPEVT